MKVLVSIIMICLMFSSCGKRNYNDNPRSIPKGFKKPNPGSTINPIKIDLEKSSLIKEISIYKENILNLVSDVKINGLLPKYKDEIKNISSNFIPTLSKLSYVNKQNEKIINSNKVSELQSLNLKNNLIVVDIKGWLIFDSSLSLSEKWPQYTQAIVKFDKRSFRLKRNLVPGSILQYEQDAKKMAKPTFFFKAKNNLLKSPQKMKIILAGANTNLKSLSWKMSIKFQEIKKEYSNSFKDLKIKNRLLTSNMTDNLVFLKFVENELLNSIELHLKNIKQL